VTTRLYALPLRAHERLGIDVGSICWGSCGRGSVGSINLDRDEAIPCSEPASGCPQHDQDSERPYGTVQDGMGRECVVFLRRLRRTA
jgi:hypothetical protein